MKTLPKLLAIAAIGAFITPILPAHAGGTVGRILLQVEERGEAWYVDPISQQRLYVTDGSAAFAALRTFGLGISNANIEKIPVGLNSAWQGTDTDADGIPNLMEESLGTDIDDADTDGDGYLDGNEVFQEYDPNGSGMLSIDRGLAHDLSGRIILQVESRGEAWYINPVDEKRYYMADGESAFAVMKALGLGITNGNLSDIPVYTGMLDCGVSATCFASAVQANISVFGQDTETFDFGIGSTDTTVKVEQLRSETSERVFTAEVLNSETSNRENVGMTCVYSEEHVNDMVAMLKRWENQEFNMNVTLDWEDENPIIRGSGDLFDFATCTLSGDDGSYIIQPMVE